MLEATCEQPGKEPEPVEIINFIGPPPRVVLLRPNGTLLGAKISWLTNVRDETETSRSSELPPLSQRQRDVLIYLIRGYSNSRIAKELGIGEQTVKSHVSIILAKIGVMTRAEAVSFAKDNNIV